MSNVRLLAIVLLVTAAAACKIDPLPPKVDAARSDADIAPAHPDASLDLQADSPRDQAETPTYPDVVGLDARTPDSRTGPDSPVAPVDVPSVLPDGPAVSVDAPSADRAPDVAVAPVDVSSEAGPACATTCDDGFLCTTDTCVAGTCQSTPKLGYCVIEKACYTDGDTKPTDTCQACSITVSTSAWSAQPEGAKCGTSKSCQSGTCAACGDVGQACCGASPGTCTAGATCDSGTSKCVADKAIDISGGYNTFCALFQSGRVRCWGSSGPMLGTGTNTASSGVAPPASGLQDAVQLSVGRNGVCAVRATGSVVCWGDPVKSGASTNVSVVVPGITNATQVSVGDSHACVRTADSKILCWGQNGSGQFGDGTQNGNSSPTQMLGVTDGRIVATSCKSTCVLRAGGQVSCTGAASQNGLAASVSVATNLPTVSTASSLSGNPTSCSFCAVGGAGGLSCWGSVLGVDPQTPGTVAGIGQVLSAVLDNGSIWAVQQDHSLWALGTNSYGQLGDGTLAPATTYYATPRLAHVSAPLGGVVTVAIGGGYYGVSSSYQPSPCLLRDNGSVSCAGYGNQMLGDGQSQPVAKRTPFVPVVGILPVASEDGQCFDGVDNDGNGKSDLDDPACAQDLGSATGTAVATVPFTGIFGNYLQESCNTKSGTSNFGGPEAVLVWTAPSGGTYQFDTNGSSFDTVLAAFKGNPQTTAELACNDNGAGLSGNASAIQVQVITGDKLTLVVDSKAAPTGTASFTLNITKQ